MLYYYTYPLTAANPEQLAEGTAKRIDQPGESQKHSHKAERWRG